MFSWIFYGLLFYFLFKLVVDFIFPIVMTSRKVKQQFNAMKQKAEAQQQNSGSYNQSSSPKNHSLKWSRLARHLKEEEEKKLLRHGVDDCNLLHTMQM